MRRTLVAVLLLVGCPVDPDDTDVGDTELPAVCDAATHGDVGQTGTYELIIAFEAST